MSNTVTKSAFSKDSVFGSGLYKKHRRRRYRNRNSNLKKKRSKKVYTSKRPNNFKFKPNSERIMSNWYWENYKKAVEWQERHKVAHWKSCALALLEENRYLLQIINNMRPGKLPEMTVTENLGKGLNYNGTYANVGSSKYFGFPHHTNDDINQDHNFNNDGVDNYNNNDDDDDDEEDDDENNDVSAEDNEDANDNFEFEMSEEMIKFFEQSYKHKMDLKKLREKEIKNTTEQEIKKIQTNKVKRSTEMKLLYGDGASMIIGMETAVQLSFDKYCDTKSPKYWPNIPFRL